MYNYGSRVFKERFIKNGGSKFLPVSGGTSGLMNLARNKAEVHRIESGLEIKGI